MAYLHLCLFACPCEHPLKSAQRIITCTRQRSIKRLQEAEIVEEQERLRAQAQVVVTPADGAGGDGGDEVPPEVLASFCRERFALAEVLATSRLLLQSAEAMQIAEPVVRNKEAIEPN